MDNLHKRADIYAEQVQKAFTKTVNKILALYKSVPDVNVAEGVMFSFDDDIKTRKAQVERLIRELHSVVVVAVDNGIELEWDKANENLDNAITDLFPEVDQKSMPAWFERNNSAMKAFTQRVISGITLSDRVWKTVKQLRHELEVAMTIAIGQGKSASRMSRDVRKYLKDPDLMFRRFRYKKGETEDGQPIWGRKWKKRIIDPVTGKFKFIDYDRDSYPSGRGVYKSAAKNAMRIARTETNMAYRMADNDRWGRLPFVLGQRIQLSHSHPHYDICDELAGVYPKSFIFVGWHPQCFCFSTPVLVSENEILKANKAFAKGEKYTPKGKEVTEMPKAFNKWVIENKDSIILSRKKDKEPYFLKYNKAIVDKLVDEK